MNHLRCTVIVRAFNEERSIARLLTGIRQQRQVESDVVLVDSGSTDATVAIAKQFGVKVVSISPTDFTFGRALNLGCEYATHDLLVLASAHVYPVYRDWLAHLLKPFERAEASLTYGRQIGDVTTKYSEHRLFAKWFPNHSDHNQQHPFCNNANAAVRKSVWQQYRYDESLTGLEDLDFAKRILRDGHRLAYIADAPIVHVHEETASRIYNRYRREAIAMKQIMPTEGLSLIDVTRLFVGNTSSDLFHAACDGQLLRNLADIPLFRAMQFWGAYRGFQQRGPVSSALRERFYFPNGFSRKSATELREQQPVDYTDHFATVESPPV